MALGGSKSDATKKTTATIRRLEGLRKDATRPVTFRMDPRDVEKLERIAAANGLKLSQLIKSWILQRMREENL